MQRGAPYEWQCLGCVEPNAALRTQCVRCACPPCASAKQVELSQQQLRWQFPSSSLATTYPATPDAEVIRFLAAGFFAVGWLLLSYAAPPMVFALGTLATLVAALLRWFGAQATNPSIERTFQRTLRALCAAAHVER